MIGGKLKIGDTRQMECMVDFNVKWNGYKIIGMWWVHDKVIWIAYGFINMKEVIVFIKVFSKH